MASDCLFHVFRVSPGNFVGAYYFLEWSFLLRSGISWAIRRLDAPLTSHIITTLSASVLWTELFNKSLDFKRDSCPVKHYNSPHFSPILHLYQLQTDS